MNRLCYGDCLTLMQDMPPASVDLIYLDPPFNSNRDYNAIYKDETGRPLPDQIEAFSDLWELNEERERAIRRMPVLMRQAGLDDDVAEFWRLWAEALRKTQPKMLAYLSYMAERLLLMRGVLKTTGSIYLHCDMTASHYLKIIMVIIFNKNNFNNEIIWHYRRWTTKSMRFQKMHDVILWYSLGNKYKFNILMQEYSDIKFIEDTVRGVVDGKLVRLKDESGNYIKRNRSKEGVPMHDVWNDINFIGPTSKERLGYATQKPLALLDRIIRASSHEGDVVFDPFCGCATTIEAAHRLKRRWIGVDIAIHAVKRVAKVRLEDRLGLKEGADFSIEGVPHSLEGAQDLWERDKYHFQKWAIEQIDGFVTSRKTADGGIDGRLYFDMPGEKQLQSMVLEVKGGRTVGIGVVRDLRGVLERDNALMAGLIVMDDLGERKAANFRREMAAAGDLAVMGVNYARMQLLTVRDILGGKRFSTPSVARGKTVAQPSLPIIGRE